jgi:hypothetical protein
MQNAETFAAEADWHYELNGVRTGPVTEDEMAELISSNKLGRGSFVWKKGMTDWMTLEKTAFSDRFANEPPPLTGAAVSNTVVWWLAFAPLIGLFIEEFLSGATHKSPNDFWWVTLVLNIALSIADEKKLKQAGHKTDQMGPSFIVPVYLFKRAKILNQSNSYFIVWLVLFGLSLFADF